MGFLHQLCREAGAWSQMPLSPETLDQPLSPEAGSHRQSLLQSKCRKWTLAPSWLHLIDSCCSFQHLWGLGPGGPTLPCVHLGSSLSVPEAPGPPGHSRGTAL